MKRFASVFCQTRVYALLVASVGFMMVCAVPITLHATALNGIQVVVKGLNSDQGRVGCGLFKGPDGFPRDRGKEFAGMWAPIHRGVAVCTFKGIPPATYAVTVLDDQYGRQDGLRAPGNSEKGLRFLQRRARDLLATIVRRGQHQIQRSREPDDTDRYGLSKAINGTGLSFAVKKIVSVRP